LAWLGQPIRVHLTLASISSRYRTKCQGQKVSGWW